MEPTKMVGKFMVNSPNGELYGWEGDSCGMIIPEVTRAKLIDMWSQINRFDRDLKDTRDGAML